MAATAVASSALRPRQHQNRYLYTAVFPVLFTVRVNECDFNSSGVTISPFVSRIRNARENYFVFGFKLVSSRSS